MFLSYMEKEPSFFEYLVVILFVLGLITIMALLFDRPSESIIGYNIIHCSIIKGIII